MLKKVMFLVLFIFANAIGYGQTERDSIVQIKMTDGLNQAEFYLSIPLGKKLSLNSGMNATYINALNEVNFPVFLQYKVNNKLNFLVGSSLKKEWVSSSHFPRGYSRSSPYGLIEIRYDFNEKVFGKVLFQKSLDNMPALNFGNNPNENIRFSTGFSF